MPLKPQDVYVTIKLALTPSPRSSYAQLGLELAMSPSEVHASVKRAQASGLIHGKTLDDKVNLTALEEFLFHGLKYAFPAEHGSMTRGVPTSYAAEPLSILITASSDPPPVWPHEAGTVRGIALMPLYKTVPAAALRDPKLHQALALVDAIREGRARERKLAQEGLSSLLKVPHAPLKH